MLLSMGFKGSNQTGGYNGQQRGSFQVRGQTLLRRFRNQDNLPVVADNVTVVRNLTCANQGAQVRQAGI